MQLKVSFFLFFLVLFSELYCQDYSKYYSFIYKAESAKYKNKNDSVLHYYISAIKYASPQPKDLNSLIKNCFLLKKYDLAISYLRMYMEYGIDTADIRFQFDVNSLINIPKWDSLLIEYPKIRSKYFSSININFYTELLCLLTLDQYGRKQKITSTQIKWELLDDIDNKNMNRLIELVKQYGWPSQKENGCDAYIILMHGLVNHHNDSTEWAFFEPVLKQELMKGTISPWDFAYLTDRFMINHGTKEQVFGTHIGQIPNEPNFNKFYPIQNINEVDKRRREIYLFSTLEESAIRMNTPLPIEYIH